MKNRFQTAALLSVFSLFLLWAAASGQKNDNGGDFILIPAGAFMMGDSAGEGDEDEKPVHTVELDSFYINSFEVINAEYAKFIRADGYRKKQYWKAGGFMKFNKPDGWDRKEYHGGRFPGNEMFPVVGVSWYEAMAYCAWLTERMGKVYRLPTEAEWEKAARDDKLRKYPWGNEIDGTYANYEGCRYSSGGGIMPVGFFFGSTDDKFATKDNRSPYGVYDMAGNVWEWCQDWYSDAYYGKSERRNPQGPFYGGYRTMRGGGWDSPAHDLRCANRQSTVSPLSILQCGFQMCS